jgi:hypothetical protein
LKYRYLNSKANFDYGLSFILSNSVKFVIFQLPYKSERA